MIAFSVILFLSVPFAIVASSYSLENSFRCFKFFLRSMGSGWIFCVFGRMVYGSPKILFIANLKFVEFIHFFLRFAFRSASCFFGAGLAMSLFGSAQTLHNNIAFHLASRIPAIAVALSFVHLVSLCAFCNSRLPRSIDSHAYVRLLKNRII